MQVQRCFPITEASQTAEVRRVMSDIAYKLNFNETEIGKIALVVTEAATNLLKHATQGQLVIRALEQAGNVGLELLALDRGPGIVNIDEALRDGYSTAGSSGTGLGAISRLATEFDLYSQMGTGTAILARFWLQPRPAPSLGPTYQLGVVSLPKAGEQLCGDGWAVRLQANGYAVVVADGLGHGPDAAKAAQTITQVLDTHPTLAPAAYLTVAHAAAHSTRGAAVAVAQVDWSQQIVHFAGIGNISAQVNDGGQRRHLVSHNGIVGHEMRKVQEFTTPWSANARLILHSDGLTTHWDLANYPGLITHDPSLVAGVLYRDFTRERDDVTVLVIQQREA